MFAQQHTLFHAVVHTNTVVHSHAEYYTISHPISEPHGFSHAITDRLIVAHRFSESVTIAKWVRNCHSDCNAIAHNLIVSVANARAERYSDSNVNTVTEYFREPYAFIDIVIDTDHFTYHFTECNPIADAFRFGNAHANNLTVRNTVGHAIGNVHTIPYSITQRYAIGHAISYPNDFPIRNSKCNSINQCLSQYHAIAKCFPNRYSDCNRITHAFSVCLIDPCAIQDSDIDCNTVTKFFRQLNTITNDFSNVDAITHPDM